MLGTGKGSLGGGGTWSPWHTPVGFPHPLPLDLPCNLHLYPYLKETFQGEVGRFWGLLSLIQKDQAEVARGVSHTFYCDKIHLVFMI